MCAVSAGNGAFPFVAVLGIAKDLTEQRKLIGGGGRDNIGNAVNGVCAVKCARRAAHDFNALGQLVMGIKQGVDIGKAR